ncbi:MAG TPA: M20/M25/M40 family metallo-hydrolase [Vicinamibacterales bacterium]|nr:M20/M25/M40 family metallo-hydrolase [Vicinamibacterales bacterium]
MSNAFRRAFCGAGIVAAAVCVTAAQQPPPAPKPPAGNQALARDILQEIVAIRSVHDTGTKGVADALAARFKAAGFAPADNQLVPEDKYPKQVNLVVRLRGKGHGKPVLWLCHMDVVDARPEDWSLPPFELTEKDGYFYGRGTSDMKDEDAAVAATLIRLKKEGYVPDRDLIVAFTADEEVGLEQDGPAFLLKRHRNLVDAGLVINADGGSGEIVKGKRLDFAIETVQKIYMTFKMEVTNRGGHSSEPRPDNAIYQLASGLQRLARYQFPFETNATTRLYFEKVAALAPEAQRADMRAVARQPLDQPAAARLAKDPALNAILHTTCVATMLAAGVQENALAQRADATIQCRVFPGESVAQTQATLQKVAADPGIRISLMEPVTIAPESAPTPQFMAAVQKVVTSMWPGVPVVPTMAAGASDSIFTRNAGLPSYGVGGGWNDLNDLRMHGRDERVAIDAFYSTAEFTYRLMKELGSGAPLGGTRSTAPVAPAFASQRSPAGQ